MRFSDVLVFIGQVPWYKRLLNRIAVGGDRTWDYVGAKHAVQSSEDIGLGFVGWVWRSSIPNP